MNVTDIVTNNVTDTLISGAKVPDESHFEYLSNFLLGIAFLIITLLAAGR